MCVPYGVKANSDTDDDEWVSIFVLCMSVCVCRVKTIRISYSMRSAADILRCVSSVFYFLDLLLLPSRAVSLFLCDGSFILFDSFLYILFLLFFSFFFLSETRSFPSGIRFGRQRDDDDTHSRKSQTQTHIYIYIHKQLVALWRIFYYWLFLLR